jgi:hypothetical protein
MDTVVHTSLSPITSIGKGTPVSASRSRHKFNHSNDDDDDDDKSEVKQDNRKLAAAKKVYSSSDESLTDTSEQRITNLNNQQEDEDDNEENQVLTEYTTSSAQAKQGFIPAPAQATSREQHQDRMYESATLASGVDLPYRCNPVQAIVGTRSMMK